MPGGRPTLYDPMYCEMLVEHMSDGSSATSFAAEIDVSRDTISEWAKVHPEFSVALSRGKAKCAAWWEKVGRQSAMEGKGNATMIVFGLKNMSKEDWQEKIAHVGGDPETDQPVRVITRRIVDVRGDGE